MVPGLGQGSTVGVGPGGVPLGHSMSHSQLLAQQSQAQRQTPPQTQQQQQQVTQAQMQQMQHMQRQQMMAAQPAPNAQQQQLSYQQQYQIQQQQYQQAYEHQQAQLQQQHLYQAQQERQLASQGMAPQQSRLVANRVRLAEEATATYASGSPQHICNALRQQVYRFSSSEMGSMGDQLGLGIWPPDLGIGGGSASGLGLAPLELVGLQLAWR